MHAFAGGREVEVGERTVDAGRSLRTTCIFISHSIDSYSVAL